MKTLKLFILAAVILAASCKKEINEGVNSSLANPQTSTSPNDESLNGVNLINENQIIDPELSMATETESFAIIDDGIGEDEDFNNNAKKVSHPLCFMKCLKSLWLDSNQAKALHASFLDLHKCKFLTVQRIKAINDSIINHANGLRNKLIGDYKAGNITQTQLISALRKLHFQTKLLLSGHLQRRILIKGLTNCYNNLKGDLAKTLNVKQKIAFKSCLIKC